MTAVAQQTNGLIDKFGRRVDYIRLSVTDRCDFRCVYCMTEEMQFVPRRQVLTLEELYTVARAFTELGVSRIRLTGGEPMVRSNVMHLIERLGELPGLDELLLTTNGNQLDKYSEPLKSAASIASTSASTAWTLRNSGVSREQASSNASWPESAPPSPRDSTACASIQSSCVATTMAKCCRWWNTPSTAASISPSSRKCRSARLPITIAKRRPAATTGSANGSRRAIHCSTARSRRRAFALRPGGRQQIADRLHLTGYA